MPVWLLILILVLFTFIITSVVLYSIQDKFIFHPEKLPLDYKFHFRTEFKELFLNTAEGDKLNGIYFSVKKPKGLIIYFHNNSGNIKIWGETASILTKFDYNVLLIDYRGFGKNSSKINEKLMFDDAQDWYDYALKEFKESDVILYGIGLGAAFATKLAANNAPKRLILESPIYSLAYSARTLYPYLPYYWVLKYSFDTASFFTEVECPVTIFHGKENKTVHYSSSTKLLALKQDHVDLYLLEGTNYHNTTCNPKYMTVLESIL